MRALFFDGLSSRAQPVTVTVEEARMVVSSVEPTLVLLTISASQLVFEEQTRHGPCVIALPRNARLETDNKTGFAQLRKALGKREGLAERLQQNWQAVCGLISVVLLFLFAAYQWGVPLAAEQIAEHLPARWEAELGVSSLAYLDEAHMQPSQLPVARQQAIRALFGHMAQAQSVSAELQFRSFKAGPNAFALPGGTVVLTDQMVDLASDDSALAGVLAHELGHIKHRHMTRSLVQAAALSSIAAVLWGDLGTLAVTLPSAVAHLGYSRDFEREADRYACDVLTSRRESVEPLAFMFEKLQHKAKQPDLPVYAASHPPTPERIRFLRDCGKAQ